MATCRRTDREFEGQTDRPKQLFLWLLFFVQPKRQDAGKHYPMIDSDEYNLNRIFKRHYGENIFGKGNIYYIHMQLCYYAMTNYTIIDHCLLIICLLYTMLKPSHFRYKYTLRLVCKHQLKSLKSEDNCYCILSATEYFWLLLMDQI